MAVPQAAAELEALPGSGHRTSGVGGEVGAPEGFPGGSKLRRAGLAQVRRGLIRIAQFGPEHRQEGPVPGLFQLGLGLRPFLGRHGPSCEGAGAGQRHFQHAGLEAGPLRRAARALFPGTEGEAGGQERQQRQ